MSIAQSCEDALRVIHPVFKVQSLFSQRAPRNQLPAYPQSLSPGCWRAVLIEHPPMPRYDSLPRGFPSLTLFAGCPASTLSAVPSFDLLVPNTLQSALYFSDLTVLASIPSFTSCSNLRTMRPIHSLGRIGVDSGHRRFLVATRAVLRAAECSLSSAVRPRVHK